MMSGCLGFAVPGWLQRRRLARRLAIAVASGQVRLPPGMDLTTWLNSPAGKDWAAKQ